MSKLKVWAGDIVRKSLLCRCIIAADTKKESYQLLWKFNTYSRYEFDLYFTQIDKYHPEFKVPDSQGIWLADYYASGNKDEYKKVV